MRLLKPELEDLVKGLDPEAVMYTPWGEKEGSRKYDTGFKIRYRKQTFSVTTQPMAYTKVCIDRDVNTPPGVELSVLRKDGPVWFWSKKTLYEYLYSPGRIFSGVLLNWDRIYCRHTLKSFRFPQNGQNSYFNRNYEVYTNKLGVINKIIDPEVRGVLQKLHGALNIDKEGINYLAYGHIPDREYMEGIINLLLLVSRRVDRLEYL